MLTRAIVYALMILGLWSPPTQAATVLCYGDSITWGDESTLGPENYPAQLRVLRPDWNFWNGGLAFDYTGNLDRFQYTLTFGPFQVITILLGTNDPNRDPTLTPEQSVKNLLTMAKLGKRSGAEVYILTPTPSSEPIRNAYTRAMTHLLLRKHVPHGIHVADLRDEFSVVGFASVSTDGVHPTAAGQTIIAEFVASLLPPP